MRRLPPVDGSGAARHPGPPPKALPTLVAQKARLRAALCAAGIVVGVGVGMTLAAVHLYFAFTSTLVDLGIYRMGGAAILHGADPYAEPDARSGLPFTYTPFAAALFAPMSLPSVRVAQVLWTSAQLIALWFFCAVSTGALCRLPGRPARLFAHGTVAGAAMALEPVRSTFSFGQINVFLAFMITADLLGRHRLLPRGVLVGIAAGIKLTPLIFLPYLLFTRQRVDAATATVSFLATVAVGFAVSPGPSATYWTRIFFDADHVGGIPYVANQSLLGVLSRFFGGPEQAKPAFMVIGGLVLVAGVTAAALLTLRGQALLGISTCALTGLLCSPISWSHHWVWLVPLLLCLLLDPARPAWGRAAALAGCALAVLAPIWWAPHSRNAEFAHHGWQLLYANSYAGAALLLLPVLLWHAYRSRSRGRADPTTAPVAPVRTTAPVRTP